MCEERDGGGSILEPNQENNRSCTLRDRGGEGGGGGSASFALQSSSPHTGDRIFLSATPQPTPTPTHPHPTPDTQ